MRIADELLDRMMAAASAKAVELGVAVSVAIVDDGGHLVRFRRMQASPLTSVGVSQDKAYTAAASGFATHAIFEVIKDDPMLMRGIPEYPRILVIGGGYPIHMEGCLAGGIGVSGGSVEQDMQIASAGLSAL